MKTQGGRGPNGGTKKGRLSRVHDGRGGHGSTGREKAPKEVKEENECHQAPQNMRSRSAQTFSRVGGVSEAGGGREASCRGEGRDEVVLVIRAPKWTSPCPLSLARASRAAATVPIQHHW